MDNKTLKIKNLIDTFALQMSFLERNYQQCKAEGDEHGYNYYFGQWASLDYVTRELRGVIYS